MDKELLAAVYDMSREELMGVVIALIKDKPVREAIDEVRGMKKKRPRRQESEKLFEYDKV